MPNRRAGSDGSRGLWSRGGGLPIVLVTSSYSDLCLHCQFLEVRWKPSQDTTTTHTRTPAHTEPGPGQDANEQRAHSSNILEITGLCCPCYVSKPCVSRTGRAYETTAGPPCCLYTRYTCMYLPLGLGGVRYTQVGSTTSHTPVPIHCRRRQKTGPSRPYK